MTLKDVTEELPTIYQEEKSITETDAFAAELHEKKITAFELIRVSLHAYLSDFSEKAQKAGVDEYVHSELSRKYSTCLDDLSKEVGKVGKDITCREAKLIDLQDELQKISEKINSLQQDSDGKIRKVRRENELLSQLMGVKWDLDAADGLVSGYLINSATDWVHHFSLDKRNNTDGFIRDYLWSHAQKGVPPAWSQISYH